MDVIVMVVIGFSILYLIMNIGGGIIEVLEESKKELLEIKKGLKLNSNVSLLESATKLNSALDSSFNTNANEIIYLRDNSKGVFNELDGVAVFYNKYTDTSTFISSSHLFSTIFSVLDGKDPYYINIHEQFADGEEFLLKIIPTGYSKFSSSYEMLSSITNLLSHVNLYPDSDNEEYVINRTRPGSSSEFNIIMKLAGVTPVIKNIKSDEAEKSSEESEKQPITEEDKSDIERIREEAKRRRKLREQEDSNDDSEKLEEDDDSEDLDVMQDENDVQELDTPATDKEEQKITKRRVPLIQLMKEREDSSNEDEVSESNPNSSEETETETDNKSKDLAGIDDKDVRVDKDLKAKKDNSEVGKDNETKDIKETENSKEVKSDGKENDKDIENSDVEDK